MVNRAQICRPFIKLASRTLEVQSSGRRSSESILRTNYRFAMAPGVPSAISGDHQSKRSVTTDSLTSATPGLKGKINSATERVLTGGDEFLLQAVPRIVEDLVKSYKNPNSKVVEFLQPNELKKVLDTTLYDGPTDNEELVKLLNQATKHFIKTGHPHFFNQLFAGMDPFALGGAFITEALNCSAYTYEIAPVNTIIEYELLQKIGKEYIGWKEVDGIFCPGGSICNMHGVSMARHKKFPESKAKGMIGIPPVAIFTSELSHYSVKKAAFFMGLGLDNVFLVKCDSQGKMIPEELEKEIVKATQQGIVPLMVNGTAGTTVMGAFDPIDELADICERHGNIWLHIDACWGGAALLSPKLKNKLRGVDRADSLAWDPHKLVGAIQQCAIFVTKWNGLMADAHSANAKYLFQQDKIYDTTYDTGDKSIQCGRKIDAFRFWIQWKAYGTRGMAERVEICFDNSRHLRDLVHKTPGFRLISEPEFTNVCFWYIPPSLRDQEENDDWWQALDKVAPVIKGRMQEQGTTMCGYQRDRGHVNFWRMICANAQVGTEAMDHVIAEIIRLGADL